MNMQEKLESVMGLYNVNRFHAIPVNHQETVAEHSYCVAMLCNLVLGPKCTAAVLIAALTHDLPEQEFGDIPSPVKKEFMDYNRLEDAEDRFTNAVVGDFYLTTREEQVVKLCDVVAGILFVRREMQMGNNHPVLLKTYRNYVNYLGGLKQKLCPDAVLHGFILDVEKLCKLTYDDYEVNHDEAL